MSAREDMLFDTGLQVCARPLGTSIKTTFQCLSLSHRMPKGILSIVPDDVSYGNFLPHLFPLLCDIQDYLC